MQFYNNSEVQQLSSQAEFNNNNLKTSFQELRNLNSEIQEFKRYSAEIIYTGKEFEELTDCDEEEI